MRFQKSSMALVLSVFFTGSVVAVNEELLADRTSFTLGLETDQFRIYEIKHSSSRVDYRVSTDNGKTYRCYVMGRISSSSDSMSDAMCSQMNQDEQANYQTPVHGVQCNALLQAAGRCE